jgi:DNA polymerase III epsilon subunit-like protein
MYAILDTETTDLRPGQIAQLSYILLDADKNVTWAKNFFFSVDTMNYGAQAVHGFSKNKLAVLSWGRVFADHAQEIHTDLHDKTIIIHNVSFDTKFMEHELQKIFKTYKLTKSICTMKHFTDICKLPSARAWYKWPKVAEVLAHLRVQDTAVLQEAQRIFGCADIGYHDARFDTAAVLAMMPHVSI